MGILLPSDVIFEILSRTPVKSLCRFRCVSKEWRTLISDPAFTAAHGRHRAETPLLLAVPSSCEPSLRLIDMNGRVVKVIDNLGWPSLMSICNSTPDHVVGAITSLNAAKVIDLVTGKVLLETRLKGSIWGFGRAAPSGAYKLLCLGHRICEVLTVGGEEDSAVGWRRKQPPPADYTLSWYTEPAAVNGTLHVLAEEEEQDQRLNIAVLCFDLESEVWKKVIKGPPDLQGPRGCRTDICELNDGLCMVQTTAYGCTADVWVLTDGDRGIWSKAYAVRRDPSVHLCVMPLRVVSSDDGGKLLFYYVLRQGRTSVPQLYDPRDGTCTDAMKMPGDHNQGIGLCSLPLECFVLAKSSVLD